MNKIKIEIVLTVIILILTSCGNNSYNEKFDNSSVIEQSSSSENETRESVSFSAIKDDLVGVYGANSNYSAFNFEYIFWDNGEFLAFDSNANKLYTHQNSTAEYFIVKGKINAFFGIENNAILVSIKHEDGTLFEVYLRKIKIDKKETSELCPAGGKFIYYEMDYDGKIDSTYYLPSINARGLEKVRIGETSFREFKDKVIGVYQISFTPEGNLLQFHLEDGKYVKITFNDRLIVTSMEEVDDTVESYSLKNRLED